MAEVLNLTLISNFMMIPLISSQVLLSKITIAKQGQYANMAVILLKSYTTIGEPLLVNLTGRIEKVFVIQSRKRHKMLTANLAAIIHEMTFLTGS